jgi:ribosomal protein S18 acetylase RimI-like enzyme
LFAHPEQSRLGRVPDSPSLRPVEPADTRVIGDIFLAALAGMTYLPELYTEEETRAFIRDVLLPRNEVWVAEDGGRVVGFLGLYGDVVSHLWVHPDQQNRGVGTALLALAMERRPSGLRLQVFQQNVGARRLYERHGFTLVRLADGSGNQEGEPEAFYEWRPGEPA